MSEQPSDNIDKAADRKVNSIGYAAARAAINAGAVSEAAWSFDAADGDVLLGEDGDDWRGFGRANLAVNTDEDPESKARFSYPWGKLAGGRLTLFTRALRAIRGRAAQQGDTSIFEAAGRLTEALGDGDGDKSPECSPGTAEAFERAALTEAERRPTEAMAVEADRGLAWHQRHQRGGSPLELARAMGIRARAPLPGDVIAHLIGFFAEHAHGRDGDGWSPGQRGYPSAARIRWALAGGDAGYRWAVRTGQAVRHGTRQRDAAGLITKAALIQERSDAGVTFVASDKSVDRLGDIIVAAGWHLEVFPVEEGDTQHLRGFRRSDRRQCRGRHPAPQVPQARRSGNAGRTRDARGLEERATAMSWLSRVVRISSAGSRRSRRRRSASGGRASRRRNAISSGGRRASTPAGPTPCASARSTPASPSSPRKSPGCRSPTYIALQDGSRRKVNESWLGRVLRRPNSYQTRSDFWLFLIRALLLDGNAYALAQRNGRGEVDRPAPAPPADDLAARRAGDAPRSSIRSPGRRSSSRRRVERRADGAAAGHAADPAVHPRPSAGRRDADRRRRLQIVSGVAIQRSTSAFFSRQARPSGILRTPAQAVAGGCRADPGELAAAPTPASMPARSPCSRTI